MIETYQVTMSSLSNLAVAEILSFWKVPFSQNAIPNTLILFTSSPQTQSLFCLRVINQCFILSTVRLSARPFLEVCISTPFFLRCSGQPHVVLIHVTYNGVGKGSEWGYCGYCGVLGTTDRWRAMTADKWHSVCQKKRYPSGHHMTSCLTPVKPKAEPKHVLTNSIQKATPQSTPQLAPDANRH